MATAKKLPSGSWRCRVLVRIDKVLQPDGTYKPKKIYKSFTCQDKSKRGKAEAERMAAEYLLSHKESSDQGYTLSQAMDNVIKIKHNTLSPTTIRTYISLKNTAYPSIIDKKISQITTADIQNAMNDLAIKSSPKHVHNAYGFFTSVIAMYYPDKTYRIKLPQKTTPKTHTPTDDELKRVIEYFKEKDPEMLKAIYLAAFGTLRRGEICGADASDIDGNNIYIHQEMVLDESNNWVIKTPKTEKSTRYVYFPDFVIAEMPKEGRLVSICPAQISNRFAKGLKHCDVQKFRFHDLRHYAASIMHALGIPDQYIMLQGGWSSDGVLKRVYRGTMEDYQNAFAERAALHFENNFKKDAT